MLRHLATVLMILASFSAQARMDFMCKWMDGAVLAYCCCAAPATHDGATAVASADRCCDRVLPVDAPLGRVFAQHLPDGADHSLPVHTPLFGVLPLLFQWLLAGSHRSPPPLTRTLRYWPSRAQTYLHTARLRL